MAESAAIQRVAVEHAIALGVVLSRHVAIGFDGPLIPGRPKVQRHPAGIFHFRCVRKRSVGWLTYRKAGRAGLVFAEAGGSGGADDSWRDQDYEDEMAYRESLEEGQAGG